ncbi:lantibiotic dehydratase [Nocardiopsis coralliicola]
MWPEEALRRAVTHAAPGLAGRLDDISSGRRSAREVRTATLSLIRYVLRSRRPTPFGWWAGTAPASFGSAARVRWGPRHAAEAVAEGEWVQATVELLAGDPAVLAELPVVASSTVMMRGQRLHLPGVVDTVTVGLSAPVRRVLDQTRAPVRFTDVVDDLTVAFGVPAPKAWALCAGLVEHGILLTGLRPPSTCTAPLAHLARALATAGAKETATEVEAIADDLAVADGVQDRRALAARMREVADTPRSPIGLNLRLDADVQLPRGVGVDLADAATTLLRLAPYQRFPAWAQYHAAFLERYGKATRVPLVDLVHPDRGLGLPHGYPGSAMPKLPLNRDADRDAALFALIQEAGTIGEIVLDDAALERVGTDPTRVPPHVEMTARLHAPDLSAVEDGRYRVEVAPGYAAGVFTGRTGGEGVAEALSNLPVSVEGAVIAQVVCPPVYPHGDNVARVRQFARYFITVGDYPPADTGTAIGLDQLSVVADWGRLYLMWGETVVEPAAFHALALEKQVPPLARFLVNLPRGGQTPFLAFDWGAARALPYLPRVRRGRIVLCERRWRITNNALIPAARGWTERLRAWAQYWNMPDRVELRHGDQRLQLDLSQSAHREVLRTHVASEEEALLFADEVDSGWLDGRPHEVAATLTSAAAPHPVPAVTADADAAGAELPAGPDTRWLTAKVFAPADRLGDIVAALPDFGRDLWFLRYRSDRESDHLRLRLAVAGSDDYGAAAVELGRWVDGLVRDGACSGLSLDTYRPETGRYGDGAALAAAESVFVADSALVAEQLRAPAGDPAAVCAATMLRIAAEFTQTPVGAWFTDRPPAPGEEVPDRAVVAEAHRLIRAEPPAGWLPLAQQLRRYRDLLPPQLPIDAVVESLLHMHYNRIIGTYRAGERTVLRAARAVALGLRDRKDHQ